MSEQGWREFLAAEGVDDWVVLHGGATAVFRVPSLSEAAQLAEQLCRPLGSGRWRVGSVQTVSPGRGWRVDLLLGRQATADRRRLHPRFSTANAASSGPGRRREHSGDAGDGVVGIRPMCRTSHEVCPPALPVPHRCDDCLECAKAHGAAATPRGGSVDMHETPAPICQSGVSPVPPGSDRCG